MDTRARQSAKGRLAVVAAAGAVLLWSTNAFAAGAALERLTVTQVLALQFTAAAAVFGVARAVGKAIDGRAGQARPGLTLRAAFLALTGLTGTVALQYVAFYTAPLVAANAIAYAWPLMVVAWTALATKRSGTRASLILALVGFAGVVILFTQQETGGEARAPFLGYAAALGSALAMAWYTLTIGRSPASRNSLLLVAATAGATITLPISIAQGNPWSPSTAIAFGLYTGLVPMAAGYALWTHAMSHPTGAQLAPIAYGTPLLSTLVLLVSGEYLPTLGLVGCGLIVICALGVVINPRQLTGPPCWPRSISRCSSPHVR